MKTMLLPLALTVALAVLLLVVRRVAFRLLHRWAKTTETTLDDLVISALRGPSLTWALALAVFVGLLVSDLPPKYVTVLSRVLHVLIVLSVTVALANLAGRAFRTYVQRTNLPIPTTGLAYGLVKATIVVIGLLICLGILGISVAPLLTALGVGGLAVALALQDTLSNLFAGIHIMMEKSVRVGDFVKLETGQEGYVTDITWRTTRIRMLPNNMVVIPNSKLSQSVVVNYHLPEKRMSLLIPVSVSYEADPGRVELLLVEEAKKAVGEVPGLLGDPEPLVRFIPGFGESSLDFTLICQVGEFAEQYLAQHELRKRIFSRLKTEGIEIPFPQRTVHIRERT
ncbi:MAG: mechanosensitive ion channel family protein [Candidatus Methylomirabilia bacterium]